MHFIAELPTTHRRLKRRVLIILRVSSSERIPAFTIFIITLVMKIFFLFWVLFSTIKAAKLDGVSIVANLDEAFKQYPQNPDVMKDLMAEDAVVCFEEDCGPYKEVFDDFFEGVKTFDYLNEIRVVGKNMISGRCWDYMDYENGCHTMFYNDWTMVLNDEGKVTKQIGIMNQEQYMNAYKCVPHKMEINMEGEPKPKTK